MKRNRKLLSALAVALVLLLLFSICANAAQIDSLSVRNGILDAYVTGLSEADAANAKLYAVSEEVDGVVSVANSYSITDGKAEGTADCLDGKNGKIYVWNAGTLSPLMLDYDLIDGRAYAKDSEVSAPQSSVILVCEVSGGTLKGYEAGCEVQYTFADSVEVTGISNNISDVQPGSVVSPLFNREGCIVSLEILTSLGEENDDAVLKAYCGEHDAADGSERYKNIVGVYYSALLNTITVRFVGDEFEDGDEQHKYAIESSAVRYVVHMSDDGAVDAVDVNADWSALSEIDESNLVYVYLRYDTVDNVINEAVFYYFSEDADITDGGEYSDSY